MTFGFLAKLAKQTKEEMFDDNRCVIAQTNVSKGSYEQQQKQALGKFARRVNSFRNTSIETRSRIMLLVNAIACGDLKRLESLIKGYACQPELLSEDLPILAYVFEQQEIMFLETTVHRYEGRNQRIPTAGNLLIEVRQIKRAVCISTHPDLPSTVYQAFRRDTGRISLLPADGEDPNFVMKRAGVAACSLREVPTPPPHSSY